MQKKGFIRQLNELIPRPDPVTTEALYRFDRECAESEYMDMLTALRVVARNFSEETLQGAYEIIQRKGATYYGIAMSVKRICEAIVRDEKPILPVSNFQHGVHGLRDVVLSMPAVVGKNGIEYQVPAPLSDDELARLHESAKALREVIDGLDLE